MGYPTPARERLAPGTALEHLRKIEWDHPHWYDCCPVCEHPRHEGTHRHDCRLAHAINALVPLAEPSDLLRVRRHQYERDLT